MAYHWGILHASSGGIHHGGRGDVVAGSHAGEGVELPAGRRGRGA